MRLLSKADEKDNIPAYEDFFRDEDDEVVPLQEKDRDRILFEYMLFSYYGKSVNELIIHFVRSIYFV